MALPIVNMRPAFAAASVLGSGEWLYPGQYLMSANGENELIMQGDGNLVLYTFYSAPSGRALWASNTAGESVEGVVMQTDGNLVIYSPSGLPLWYSNTCCHLGAGAYLVDQDDGNLVIYTSTGAVLWATYTTAAPLTDWSFYMVNPNNGTNTWDASNPNSAYSLGFNQGQFDAQHNVSSMVILDFGYQAWDNVDGIWNGAYQSWNANCGQGTYFGDADVQAIAEAFAEGYWDGVGYGDDTTVLTLGMGTNNYNCGVDMNYAGGQTWAGYVNTVNSWVSSNGFKSQVTIWGADDMENGSGWAGPTATQDWISGYDATTSLGYLDFGSADGCPTNTDNNGSCSNGWNQYDEWYASWGTAQAFATPEIYYDSLAQQWYEISAYGYQYQNGEDVLFYGPLTAYRCDAGLTPTQAWDDFRDALSGNPNTARNFTYSMDICGQG